MAGAGKKTFTAGEVLTASDVNTYLMEQSVMVFGGTAARASAIPTPSTGMTSYIGVTGTASIPQIETYTGSAWQTPYGLTLVASATVSNAASLTIDNCFTSAFTNYRLVINCSTSAAVGGKFVFRTASGDYTTAEYQRQRIYVAATTVVGSRTANAANGEFNDIGPVPAGHTIDIFNPNVADYTTWVAHGLYAAVASQPELNMTVGTLANSQLVTGIKFNQAANLTGTVRVYGYRSS